MEKKKTKADITYSLCEAVADIAYLAGLKQHYSGDSRGDMASYIKWAQEFEKMWKGKEWGADDTTDDYIDEITKFAELKIKESSSQKKNG